MNTLTPVAPAVTRRTLCLLADAEQAITQALYEGSSTVRMDPAPTHGSPWETPDLPPAALDALRDLATAIQQATRIVRNAAAQQADPDLARR